MADSKENYQLDLGSEGVKDQRVNVKTTMRDGCVSFRRITGWEAALNGQQLLKWQNSARKHAKSFWKSLRTHHWNCPLLRTANG